MKNFVPMLMAAGAMTSMVGCSEESAPVAATPSAAVETTSATTPQAVTDPAADGILVSLSVPNMT